MANSTERESVISTLRACLLSSKGGIALSILNRDYKALIGDPIPYRKLGYSNVEDFVQSIENITLSPGPNGDFIVNARPTKESAHVASLVRRQKPSQKGRHTIPVYSQSRKPVNQFWKPPPSSHKRPPSPPRRPPSPQRRQPSPPNRLSVTVNNSTYEKPSRLVSVRTKLPSNKYEVPPRLQTTRDKNFDFKSSSYSENVNPETESYGFLDFHNLPLNFDENCAVNDEEMLVDEYNTYHSGIVGKSRKSILSPFSPRNAVAAGRAKTQAIAAKELEDKYTSQKIQPEEMESEEHFNDYNMEVAPWNRKKPGTGEYSVSSYEDTYIMRLHRYCLKKGWAEPYYKIIPRHPKSGGTLYGCQVKVGLDQHFSSYPFESYIQEEAKESAANKAYKKLIEYEKESHTNGLKVATDLETAFERMFKIVENHDTGLWADCLSVLYSNKFHEQLPPDWVNKAANFPKFIVNKVCEGKVIISPNSGPSLVDTIKPKSNKTSVERAAELHKPTTIQMQILPSENSWDVFVSDVAPSGNIWLRIIGKDYSERYENIACEMELYYANAKRELPSPPQDLMVNGYYAALLIDEYSSGESWHRILVQSINWNSKTAECMLVDNGDVDTLPLKHIYSLAEKFTHLPRQAVLCSVAGLEDYNIDELFRDTMVKMLVGKTLIAEVDYRDDVKHDYSLVLYDTSGEDDLNVNEELLNLFNLEFSKPELPEEQGVREVHVSHITDSGQLYIQIQSDVFLHLQKLIENLNLDLVSKHCMTFATQLKLIKMYLAKYDVDGRWYRAVLTKVPYPEDTEVEVSFIDYGNTSIVDISNICDLEAISDVLSRIPKQAVLVSLHGLPDICPEDCCKLKEMVSESDAVLLKVIASGEIPQVEVFKRTDVLEGGALISINNSISLEREVIRSKRRASVRRSRSASRPVTPSVSRPISPASSGSYIFVDTVHCSLSPPVIPELKDEFFDVFVTLAAHPHNFIVQPLCNINSLKQLIAQMKAYYSEDSSTYCVAPDDLVEGGLYAALFENNQWYRVTLASLAMKNCISVHSCDFGEFTVVSPDKLRYLAPQFTELPYQGIKAKLTEIIPIHGDWTVEDCVRFQELVVDKQLVSVIAERGPDVLNPNVTVLGLQLIDTSTDEDVVISHVLINEKRAVRVGLDCQELQ